MSCAAGLNVCVSLSVMCELHATDDVQGILCRFLKKKNTAEASARTALES